MINVIAVDDEPIALDILRDHAQKIPFIDLKATFLSATDALSYAMREPVDLILTDINMPDLSGLEFANLIRHQAQVIFTTAYAEHALKGFDLGVTDYLLKPITFNRFLQACHLAQSRLKVSAEKPVNNTKELFVKDGYQWVRINIDDLLYIKAQDNYASFHETNKQTLVRIKFSEVLSRLPAEQFMRVDKSYIVAFSKIDKIENHQITIAGNKIPVSRSYRESLLSVIAK
ncbi:MAG: DNA-binding response regulator [Mucilaginibacter sp.]|nr:DNA-binding response regulator [Mucilaginibacter sp.]